MLEKWQDMLQKLKKKSRGEAILSRMQNTLKIMKGELEKCYKPY